MKIGSNAEIEPYKFEGRQGDYIGLTAPTIIHNVHSLFSNCRLDKKRGEKPFSKVKHSTTSLDSIGQSTLPRESGWIEMWTMKLVRTRTVTT